LREQPENFLEAMLVAQEIEGRFSEEELFGNTITMLLAGEEHVFRTTGTRDLS
jgi:cytochrome P450